MRRIDVASNWTIVRDMTEWSASTGQHEPKSGLTLTGLLSLTPDGAAIHASLSKSLVEVGSTARYGATTAAGDHQTHLAGAPSLVGKVIYERVTGAGYEDYEPLLVTDGRQAGS